MSLKEKIKAKIVLDRLFNQLSEKDLNQHLRFELLRRLLNMASYKKYETRDLEIYTDGENILVLDAELPLYRSTTIEDVAMRKNPTLKEMINPFKVKRILSHKDILFLRGDETISYIYKTALSQLDLSMNEDEIREIFEESISTYWRDKPEEIQEMVEIIFEILGYEEVVKQLQLPPYNIYGIPEKKGYRDLVVISPDWREIKLITGSFLIGEINTLIHLSQVAFGHRKPDIEGINVFIYWGKQAIEALPKVNHV
ncbi:MAG TPA: hypothetical protein ENG63_10145 [Candidatus Desulfofervidus auxilii]|uniref:Uncharacterized protein n=1 Tax=Desulfofervidus auxilii TaxID=1621989 RepID=A0A7C0U480_DESA2|nr:hypothetical protein [Candidatus Desulfofervidus auxilii]